MAFEIRMLGPGDEPVLAKVGANVFDHALDPEATREFLDDPRHHIAVAIDGGLVVGFVSAVHYVHPDKPLPELWINEVSVASTHRARGIGKAMLQVIFEVGRRHGCGQAWVLTDRGNVAAMALYASAGGEVEPPDSVMFNFHLN
jgi:aminoglycoside 6'-N-acetyltransferase I